MTRPDPARLTRGYLWDQCCRGEVPAECLSTEDRAALVHTLWSRGWTDREIASHTRMSTYTTARIRRRIGLAARRLESEVA